MLAIERRSEILSLLEKDKSVLVSDLSKKFNVSEETIRRDLEKLTEDGLVKKTYGGAVLRDNIAADPSFRIREKTNQSQKRIIAQKALSLIDDHSYLMLDASSTAVMIAKMLREAQKGITLITNSVEILLDYSGHTGTKVISTGGHLREMSLSLVGHSAERRLLDFTVDKTIFSCKGLDFIKGVTESNEAEMEIKKAMIQCGRENILAVDSSKFNRSSFVKLMDAADIQYILTDQVPSEDWLAFFEKNHIKVL